MFFVCKYSSDLLDADQASELILANKLHGFDIFCEDWYYSTSLRVFDIQLFYRLGLVFSPNNWVVAKEIGQAIMFIALSAAFLFVASQVVSKELSIILSAILLCPFSFWYELTVIMFGAYIPYMILVALAMGMFLKLLQTNGKRSRILWLVLLVVHALLSGMAGVRIGMNFYAPFFLACIVVGYLRIRNNKDETIGWLQDNWKLFLDGGLVYASYVLGYLINSTYLVKKYEFDAKADMMWNSVSVPDILENLGDFLAGFGYPLTRVWQESPLILISFKGVLGLLGIITAGLFVLSIIRLATRFWSLSIFYQLVFVTTIFMIVVACGSMTLLQYFGNASYYIPCMPFFILVIGLEIMTEDFVFKFGRESLVVALIICISGTSYLHVYRAIDTPLNGNLLLKDVYNWLQEAGDDYDKGVAAFWDSNAITAWSNGNIEMWTVDSVDGVVPSHWLQAKSHSELPDEYFIILDKEDDDVTKICDKHGTQVMYENEKYYVLK